MRTAYHAKKDSFYQNAGYWFLVYILLVWAGFYYTYFSSILRSRPVVIHIHFALMVIWIGVLITQPLLIKYKKRAAHRLIGRLSYFFVPLVLLFSFLVIRLEYYSKRNGAGNPNGLFFFLWFALFYLLAIINRRKAAIHARFMFATAMTLLGPTVDRIIQVNFHIRTVAGRIPALVLTFLLIDGILLLLLIKDRREGKPTRALNICLAIYLFGQVMYYTVVRFEWWGHFYAVLMKPAL